jgi:site-specific DNA recombinase
LLEAGAALITTALDLFDNPQELYRQTTDPVRRQLNQVFFDKLYLDDDEVTDDRLAAPFDNFVPTHPVAVASYPTFAPTG